MNTNSIRPPLAERLKKGLTEGIGFARGEIDLDARSYPCPIGQGAIIESDRPSERAPDLLNPGEV